MPIEIRKFAVAIPAGTTKAANFTADLSFSARVVRQIDVLVPPGPRGEVGWRLGSSGVAVIPFEAGAYIVTDDELISWPLDRLWDSGSWTLFAYNTGTYVHILEIRFHVDLVSAPNLIGSPINPDLIGHIVGSSSG